MSKDSGVASQIISLPKGGGAVKGIGETFQPSLFTGTGNFTIPIAASPGRAGFGPQLSLQYSTGNGNGPFGSGWQLSIPRITRKTEKGLPRYNDDDVFVMSGAEDLVPCLQEIPDPANSGSMIWIKPEPEPRGEYRVTRYRPRTEGLFARIEQWTSNESDVHWRATTKDNITSIYGRTPAARIADPDKPHRIFEWLLEETFDAKGNHIRYEYAQERPDLQVNYLSEQNRSYTSQRYIRRIYYGNTPESLAADRRVGPERDGRHYVFEILFDYGDCALDPASSYIKPPDPGQAEQITDTWRQRGDPFSTYRASFEIRTLRRCQRVLMFHHFIELRAPGKQKATTLVKSTDFSYRQNPDTRVSFLESVTVTGYRWDEGEQTFKAASLPPVTFNYSEFRPHEQRYQSITAEGNELPALALSNPDYTLVDIDGNGLPDVLHTSTSGFRYWKNKGAGRFDRPHLMHHSPMGVTLSQPDISFADMAGDGRADLLVLNGTVRGFFETTPETTWETFKHIHHMPSFSLADPNVRLVDLTGDGRSDVLLTRDHHFLWFECQGEDGYSDPKLIEREHDLNEFPDVTFNDPSGRVRLADMSGDGLNDIVLVHNGRIDYWPNLGYGEFGRRITMTQSPRLEANFDPARLFLTDLDGSGCADLVYVGFDRVHFWFNQSGNGWSEEQVIHGTPVTTNATALQFADIYGAGTAALLWSYDYGQFPGSHYKVLDLCGGRKPYLLVEMDNNLGATTRVQYAPSTRFYLEDEACGRPWATKLPFPVQVVEKSEAIDHISQTKLVTTYKYHHGYFDGREREFRGFGRVDQFDTETFTAFTETTLHQGENLFANNRQAYHVPPVETRTWFHTGAYRDEKALVETFRAEFWSGDPAAFRLPGHDVAATPEAQRALRGAQLRQEVYAHDGSGKENIPYTVTESAYEVRELQPATPGQGAGHGVFLTIPKETISYHYERNPDDPRVQHSLHLETDDFGSVIRSISIGYSRRPPATPFLDGNHQPIVDGQGNPLPPHPEQRETKATYTINRYIHQPDDPAAYYIGVLCETRVFEVHGLDYQWPAPAQSPAQRPLPPGRETFAGLENQETYERYEWQPPANLSGLKKRLVDWKRIYFKQDSGANSVANGVRLALGKIEPFGLPFESYQLAFDTRFVKQVYGDDPFADRATTWETILKDEGGYWAEEGYWWIPSGRTAFDPAQFFQPVRQRDPFKNTRTIEYDHYALLPVKITDPVDNEILAANDYRVLQPHLLVDPNDNVSTVAFDALGLVVAAAVLGKVNDTTCEGDTLAGLKVDLTSEEIEAFLTAKSSNGQPIDPRPLAQQWLARATSRTVYDLHKIRPGKPAVVATITREVHDAQPGGGLSPVQVSFLYADGFGRELQTKVQAEPASQNGPIRWVATGTKIYNNKGKPVREYEPFFSDSFGFGFEESQQRPISPTLFYDPLERVVATLYPNHTYDKVLFDPWQQVTWDANDTVTLDPRTDPDMSGLMSGHINASSTNPGDVFRTWSQRHQASAEARLREAATKAAAHAGTPTSAQLDTLGRVFLSFAHNRYDGLDEFISTRTTLDIEGNDLVITDPRGIDAFRHTFDIAGRRLVIDSQDAGLRQMLPDAAGTPLVSWDAENQRVFTHYDKLRRPVEVWVKLGSDPEYLAQKTVYGEDKVSAKTTNHRGRVWRVYDGAGLATNDGYDFKGNLLQATRRLPAVRTTGDAIRWPVNGGTFDETVAEGLLEADSYTLRTAYDALSRVIRNETPDGTVQEPHYNEANLLERLTVTRTGGAVETFVENINYNARGQREFIKYGNGLTTAYTYEPDTYRLSTLVSQRHGAKTPHELQLLTYTYDPAGNLTEIRDDAQPIIFFNNHIIEPRSRYTYDAVYRLRAATGREHESMSACHYQTIDKKQTGFAPLPQPVSNAQALLTYLEEYSYDPAGNIEEVRHTGTRGGWTRAQTYAAGSNRLVTSSAGCAWEDRAIQHDKNGNIRRLAHLPDMQWDYRHQLVAVQFNHGADPNRAYYQYDASGQRVCKTVVKNGGSLVEERIYLGGFEIYRERNGGGVTFRRDTIHVLDDTRRIALIEEEKDVDDPGVVLTRRVRYQLSNHLGSATLEVDATANAALISYEEYYPYGGTAYLAGDDWNEVKRKRYRYSGKERDDETGLYYYGARYYAPWLTRWLSCDSIGPKDYLNLFVFVRVNPILLLDNFGFASTQSPEPKVDFKKTGVPPPEITEFIMNTQEGYHQYYQTLEKRGLTRSEMGSIVAERLQSDFARHFGEGVAEVRYSAIGSGHVIDISLKEFDLDIELKLSKGAIRNDQKKVFIDKAAREERTLAFISSEHYEIYHFGKQPQTKLSKLRRIGTKFASEIMPNPFRISKSGRVGRLGAALGHMPVLDIMLSPLSDTPVKDGGLIPDLYDPHTYDRIDDELEYFARLYDYRTGQSDVEPTPPWTPPDELNELGKAGLALHELEQELKIGETASTFWGNWLADKLYGPD